MSGVGQTILRQADVVVSSKRLFSHSGGLGPANVGSEIWVKAKEKQERMQKFK